MEAASTARDATATMKSAAPATTAMETARPRRNRLKRGYRQ
jgi:hypothetical protein